MNSKTSKPVVIAGAGPTGLMCAIALARQNIPVIVFEAEPALTHDLRAGSYHPPTLEMMAPYGITDRMHDTGLQVQEWQIRDKRGEYIAQFDLGLLADVTPYPYRLHLEQHRLTPIQLDILRAIPGTEVHFNHRVADYTQDGEGVRVTVETDGETRVIEASWLIGADGSRSVVRKGTGVEFEGFTWPEFFVVASTPYDLGQHGFTMNAYVSDPIEWAAVFKVPDDGPPGLWRAAFYGDPQKSDAELLDPANIERAMQLLVQRDQPYEIRYKSIYRVHQRVAQTFIHGRALLAGDAAHLNNPLGGFGLNSGIHDAINLADKLGRVWHGENETLLGVYDRQRRAATVEQVQKMSIRNKQLLQERDPVVQRQHLTELMAVAADPQRARAHVMESSMLGGLRRANAVT